MSKENITVVILTLNEEENIGRCLESLPDRFSIVVVDSGSQDKTALIARQYGASIYHRKFDNYSNQRNAALELVKGGWVVFLDADEVMDETIAEEIIYCCDRSSKKVAFRLKRQLFFMGRLMRFGRTVDYPLRIFHIGAGRYHGAIHENVILQHDIKVKKIKSGTILHYSFKNLEDYFTRFNEYTSLLAMDRVKHNKKFFPIFHYFRPWFEFLDRYLLRLGFLDGYAGYSYALISSLYSFIKYAKQKEIEI